MEPAALPSSPNGPLNPHTPHGHTGLYAIIAALSLIMIIGVVWASISFDVFPDSNPATPILPESDISDYMNAQYGFLVMLPDEWKGFGITNFEWVARDYTASGSEQEIARGPKIHIVHPSVAGGNPHQEIPILVFTVEQWGHVSGPDGDWSVSAAPIPPTELARNSQYVFALPARYNFGGLPGLEEVDTLIRNGAVSAFEL